MMTPAHCDKSPLKDGNYPLNKGKAMLQGRRYANLSINTIACLECSCHIWVPQLVYFDKIHHVHVHFVYEKKRNFFLLFPFSHFFTFPFFSLFSSAQSDSFRGVGSCRELSNRICFFPMPLDQCGLV
jgi:hypothetical protein